MKDEAALTYYKRQVEVHSALLAAYKQKSSRLGWARLAVVLATVAAIYFLYDSASTAVLWSIALVGATSFFFVLHRDADNRKLLARALLSIRINNDEIDILGHHFRHRADGSNGAPTSHAYAGDLDILGPASLFKYINRCTTEQGMALLTHGLLQPLGPTDVQQRQEAVQELAAMSAWRQKFQLFAEEAPVTMGMEQQVKDWMTNESVPFTGASWKWLVPLYSAFTLTTLGGAIAGYIPASVFSFLFLLYFIYASFLSKRVLKVYAHLSGIVSQAEVLLNLLRLLEEPAFTSQRMQGLQAGLREGGMPASGQVATLKRILGRFDLRLNTFLFIFLNSLVLWDVRQARALNAWKRNNLHSVPLWFHSLAEAEVLVSLATLHFNKPAWAFPVPVEAYCVFRAAGIGHPLLPEAQRVVSDFKLEGRGMIALITGSNMAGKSTFLRSLGINLVLAQMGAPVCAAAMEFSPMQLMSSMRIADDLSENTSTFYAELKKLKSIIEAVGTGAPLFLLLDEILRGTNSLDRHAGSKALMAQLVREQTVAVLATHDIALADNSGASPGGIENYHFDVQVGEEEELYFDYKLKTGVCQSLNAAILMRKIGIDL